MQSFLFVSYGGSINTVFKKMENSRFRCVFLDNYYLLINKKYLTYIKQHRKSLNFCTKVAVATATMTFPVGGYFDFKVILTRKRHR